ncbi:TIM barrel protein [Pseudomonas sp. PCH446]
MLRPYDLALVSGWYSSRLARRSAAEEIDAIASHVELLAQNGAKVLVYGEVADSIQGQRIALVERPRFHSEQAWREYADKLTELARFTWSRGVRLAYHHHMGAYVESPADIDKLMALTGNEVGLLFDSGIATWAVASRWRCCANISADLPCALQGRAQAGGATGTQQPLELPGLHRQRHLHRARDGDIDFAALLDVLLAADYHGWLVVEAEQDPAVAPSYIYAKKGFDTLRGLLDRRTGQ